MQNLTDSLLKHGAITTTEAKAKELRSHLEPLITKAKRDFSLANRRYLLKKLGPGTDIEQLRAASQVHAERAGGYLRITKLPIIRPDGARVVRIEIIDAPPK
jgi:large subunit ribosomal protein L17